ALAVYLVEEQVLPLGRGQQLLAERFGLRLRRGTLVGWIQRAAHVREPMETPLKAALQRARAAPRRNRRAARWATGLGAGGQHQSPHPLRPPPQTGSGSDRRHWDPPRLHRRECAGRLAATPSSRPDWPPIPRPFAAQANAGGSGTRRR